MGIREGLKTLWGEKLLVGSSPTPGTEFMKKLPIDENFFSSWSSEMSYVLGLIVADGCLCIKRTKKDKNKQFALDITCKDYDLLEKIRKVMGARQKISLKFSGRDKKEMYYRLQIGYQKICKDLLKLGIVPRKSYQPFVIKVPQKYFSDFVRGFFDGDGTVYIYKVNGTPQIKARFGSTSFPFIAQLNQRLCRALKIPEKTIHQEMQTMSKIPQYAIYFYIDDCEKLAKFMYGNNPTLFLPRKHQIFEKWKLIKRRTYVKRNYPSKIGWHLNQKVSASK